MTKRAFPGTFERINGIFTQLWAHSISAQSHCLPGTPYRTQLTSHTQWVIILICECTEWFGDAMWRWVIFLEKSNQVFKNHKIIPTHKHTSIYTPTTRGWRKGEENEKSFRLGSSSEIDGSATNPLLMSPWHSLNDRPSPLRVSKASVIRRNENAVAASCS